MSGELFVGLISGTSVDGIDAVLVNFDSGQPQLLASHCKTIEPRLRDEVLRLCEGNGIDLRLLGATDVHLGRCFAVAVRELLDQAGVEANRVAAIGSHGQTVWHQPAGNAPFTLQLGDPNTIAEHCGITTVADFRRRDMAGGGEGAPLAPLLHREVFHSKEQDRAVVNIGGIANLTMLKADGNCQAFDTGPGNVLMDYWINHQRGRRFDAGGAWALQGKVHDGLLAGLLEEPWLDLPPPRSTGRELFNGRWLEAKLERIGEAIDDADVQASLLQFTVETLAQSIGRLFSPPEIYVCGGGAHNHALMQALAARLRPGTLKSTAALGIEPDWVEAIAFAWLARQTLQGRRTDTRPFTGARSAAILGGIFQA